MKDVLRLAVVIPLFAALATGFFSGLLVLALAVWRGWPFLYGFIVAAALAFISWLGWSSRFANLIEYKLAPDLHTRSGIAGNGDEDPSPQTVNLHIDRADEGGYQEGLFLDRLPVGVDTLAALAQRVVSGQSLTTSSVTANGLDRATWEALRDRFISAGLLAWHSGYRQFGLEITPHGWAVFKRLASPPPTEPDLYHCGVKRR